MLEIYAAKNNFKILSMNGDLNHIHLLIEATPNTIIPNIIKGMKGITARTIIKEFPEIQKQLYGGHVWSPSYFVCTVSENTEQNVKNYIESQKEK